MIDLWRIKLSDDICKCMEWTTISITLAFQYNNFCFGMVLGDPGAVKSSKVCVVWTYMSWGSYQEKPRVQCTYYLHGKTGNSGWKINLVRIISFRRLQKIWAVIWDDAINLFFYPFQSVQLIWIYFVVGRSPTTSNLIDIFFSTRFPPRWFV